MRVAVAGAGGFAREVRWLMADLADAGEDLAFAGYVVSDLSALGDTDAQSGVIGQIDQLDPEDLPFEAVAVGIGTPQPRYRVAHEIGELWPSVEFPSLIHPTVSIDRQSATIGKGAMLCAGVTATVNIVLEPFAMVNINSTLGHEALVGEATVINPVVAVSGGVRIGKRVLIGTGAAILQGLAVDDDAVVGGGALVSKDVEAGSTVVGVPARPLSRS